MDSKTKKTPFSLRPAEEDVKSSERTQPIETPWLTLEQACKYLGVKPKTIYNWRNDGNIRAYNLRGTRNGPLRFRKEDLDNVVTGGKKR